ncbi:MAG TPA: isocitrate lyase/phosphoenolpyruvate mutase family protein [Alphaproteobacteria bacterium]
MNARTASSLRTLLGRGRIVMAPGCYDGLSALLIEQAGFPAAYLSGAAIAYTRFGRSDVGLVTMTEAADTLAAVTDRIGIPVIVDADTGFGNALNVQRTVRTFERAGAGAIQLEDQSTPKRCGHLAGKSLIEPAEMVGKIHAALDARRSDSTLLIARTDAIAVEGLERALDRAELYAEAGADILFIEAPQSDAELAAVANRFRGRIPLLANMVEGGRTPIHPAAALEVMGYAIVIFAAGLARAFAHMAQDYLASLRQHGTTEPYGDRMLDFDGLNAVIGTDALLDQGKKYDAAAFRPDAKSEAER